VAETPALNAEVLQPVESRLTSLWYRRYVLGMLFLTYALNTIDRTPVLGVSLQYIKQEFGATDTQLGLLSGIAFALFYSTLGIPFAAWADRGNRRNVLALAVALWSGMTALCGAAVNFTMLFATRVGTAIGEAGGSPPSHSLISDYFPKSERAKAFAIFALAIPIGTAFGNYVAGQSIQAFGWRTTFMLVGLPGLAVAFLVWLTVQEPPRGMTDNVSANARRAEAPGVFTALAVLWEVPSFRHVALAAALHSVVWYASGAFNASFLIRSHRFNAQQAGNWLAILSAIGGVGTYVGGVAADRLSVWSGDRRWYLWVPGIATLVMVPFQFGAYMVDALPVAFPSFALMMFLAAMFFGPSFAMTQALAPLKMRSVASSLLLFVQTTIGYGLGPLMVGRISDWLKPTYGTGSLPRALVIVGLVNIWAAAHYLLGARTLRADLDRPDTVGTAAHM
jgi:MFS family permease